MRMVNQKVQKMKNLNRKINNKLEGNNKKIKKK